MKEETKKSVRQLYPWHVEIPFLIILSAVLLGFGLSLPLMNLEKLVLWKNEYSILTGIVGLFQDKQYFLSALLFFFSLLFPIIKLVMLWVIWQFKFREHVRSKMLEWLSILGKWSMLDVFVVAILIVAVKLGPLANVTPRIGVYIFSLAIIISIFTALWTEWLLKHHPRQE